MKCQVSFLPQAKSIVMEYKFILLILFASQYFSLQPTLSQIDTVQSHTLIFAATSAVVFL